MDLLSLLIEGFERYYGLDYLSFVLGAGGTILLTRKSPFGFLLSAGAVFCAAIVSIIAQQYGFLLANTFSFFLLLRGFIVWRRDEKVPKATKTL